MTIAGSLISMCILVVFAEHVPVCIYNIWKSESFCTGPKLIGKLRTIPVIERGGRGINYNRNKYIIERDRNHEKFVIPWFKHFSVDIINETIQAHRRRKV